MDMGRIARLEDLSNSLAEELVAANSENKAFADALANELYIMQKDLDFLSKKYLKGFKSGIIGANLNQPELFERFIDLEWTIKRTYRQAASDAADAAKLEARMNFVG